MKCIQSNAISMAFVIRDATVRILFPHMCSYTLHLFHTEVVRAMTYIIQEGWTMYWGTSRWSQIEVKITYSSKLSKLFIHVHSIQFI